MSAWNASLERAALVQRLDDLHAAAWAAHDLVKRTELETEWTRTRAELTHRDSVSTAVVNLTEYLAVTAREDHDDDTAAALLDRARLELAES